MYSKCLNFFKEESSHYAVNVYGEQMFLMKLQLTLIDIGRIGVNAYSLKNFRHLEYTYINVLYISEAHRWSDEHDVSCLFTSYTWPSRQKFMF
jgi:hypothetical protein